MNTCDECESNKRFYFYSLWRTKFKPVMEQLQKYNTFINKSFKPEKAFLRRNISKILADILRSIEYTQFTDYKFIYSFRLLKCINKDKNKDFMVTEFIDKDKDTLAKKIDDDFIYA